MMNRPRQPKKSEKIEVRLSHEEKSALQSLARRQGRTISTIVRDLLADHLRDVLQAEQQPSIRERTAMILKPVATSRRNSQRTTRRSPTIRSVPCTQVLTNPVDLLPVRGLMALQARPTVVVAQLARTRL